MDNHDTKLVCAEVLNGYSTLENKFGAIFVRHFTPLDSSYFDFRRAEILEKGRIQGLPTAEEKEKDIISLGLWDQKKNDEIKTQKNYVSILKKTKDKQLIQSQINLYNQTIKEEEEKLKKLQTEKALLIGLTLETWVDRKLCEIYIYKAFFNDLEFKTPFFTIENYDDLERRDIDFLISEYNEVMNKFSESNLKRIGLLPYFYNLYSASGDDIYRFYGKAILNLTFFQVEIFKHASFFKKVFSNCKVQPPDEVLENPEKLLEWFNSTQNAEQVEGQNQGSGKGIRGIAGATEKDYERMGITQGENDFVDYFKEAEKAGGELDAMKMYKLHQK